MKSIDRLLLLFHNVYMSNRKINLQIELKYKMGLFPKYEFSLTVVFVEVVTLRAKDISKW